MFLALLQRDMKLLLRSSTLSQIFLFYGALLLFFSFQMEGDYPLLFLCFLALSYGFSEGGQEEQGFWDSLVVHGRGFILALLSRLLSFWAFVGIPLSLLTALMGDRLNSLPFVLSLTLSICALSLFGATLLFGARAFRGLLFILIMPFYVPLLLSSVLVGEAPHLALKLSLGLVFFYVPLGLGGSYYALKGAIETS